MITGKSIVLRSLQPRKRGYVRGCLRSGKKQADDDWRARAQSQEKREHTFCLQLGAPPTTPSGVAISPAAGGGWGIVNGVAVFSAAVAAKSKACGQENGGRTAGGIKRCERMCQVTCRPSGDKEGRGKRKRGSSKRVKGMSPCRRETNKAEMGGGGGE